MKIELLDKKFLIDMLNDSYSMKEYGRRIGNSHVDHIDVQNRISQYIGIDIKKTIELNKINKIKNDRTEFLNRIYTCDNCGNSYRNGDRLKKNKSGRHFCSDICSKQFSQKHVDIHKITEFHKSQREIIKNIYNTNPRKCSVCGNDIPYENKYRKTCSNECARISTSLNLSKSLKGTGKTGGYHEKSSRGKYGHYKGIFCASTYELAYLIYCIDHNISISRNTKGYEYIFENQKHIYYPDWIINNDTLVETKNFITNLVLIKAKAVNDKPIIILDYEKLIPCFEYVSSQYGKWYKNRKNNFYELYDEYNK